MACGSGRVLADLISGRRTRDRHRRTLSLARYRQAA